MRERIKTLEVKNVSQMFEGGNCLFKDVSLSIPLGNNVVLEGGVGSGKSFFLKILAGLIEPSRGDILYNDKSLRSMSFEDFMPMRLSTATCFETGGLLMNKTLSENIKLPLLYHKQWRSQRSESLYEELIRDFEIKTFLNLRPASVPGSVRKIAGIIRSILHNPQILFLDEPSLGLGEDGLKVLKYWLPRFRKDHGVDSAIVMASNDRVLTRELNAVRFYIRQGTVATVEKGAA